MISPRETVGRRGLQDRDWIYAKTITQAELSTACQNGDWQKVDAGSLGVLDDYATYLVKEQLLVKSLQFRIDPEWIASAAVWADNEKIHTKDSRHHDGRAFDVVFQKDLLVTAWLTAVRFHRWGGIGIHPFWTPDPGLHLDTRWAGDSEQGRGFRVMWYQDRAGKYHHLNTEQDLRDLAEYLT